MMTVTQPNTSKVKEMQFFRYQLADAGCSLSDDGQSSHDVRDSRDNSDDDDHQWSEPFHGTG